MFVVLIFIVNTINVAANMQFTMQAFVNYRNFPGGPNGYELAEFSNPIDTVANACLGISAFLSDVLLVSTG